MKKPSIRERVKKYFRNRALNKELKKWEAKFKGDKERVEKVTEMCLKVIHTAFPNENDTITIPKILGDMIYSVEETMYDKRGLNHLYFEWASERYMSDFIPEIIEAIKIFLDGVFLTLLPITIVFAFLQRNITTGIATTGMK